MAVEVAGRVGVREKLRLEWKKYHRALTKLAVSGGVAFSLIFMNHMYQHDFRFTRPAQVNMAEQLYQGVNYKREVRNVPRPLMIHVLKINVEDVDFMVSPPLPGPGSGFEAKTVSNYLRDHDFQVAVNANFFRFKPHPLPNLVRPKAGERADARGLVISDGITVSPAEEGFPALCIAGGRAKIRPLTCPDGTEEAVAGNQLIIENGKAVDGLDNTKLHPRHAAAVSADGQILWIITIDGRQPGYSEGVTLAELAQILQEMGVFRAIVLDGGGSATMVTARGTLNNPVQSGIQMQRAVGPSVGLYAEELPES